LLNTSLADGNLLGVERLEFVEGHADEREDGEDRLLAEPGGLDSLGIQGEWLPP
jgi:hypothetical protein